jgi:hypothetical protein
MAGRLIVVVGAVSFLMVSAVAQTGQAVISAKSGLVHYLEGLVMVDGSAVELKNSRFPEVKEQQVLKTEEGRAEVLLTPGVFLRVSENSSFRMLSNRLSDTRIEALTGTTMVEHGEMSKDDHVTLIFKDKTINFLKSGLYRMDADNGILRVYKGEARVEGSGQSLTVKQAREVQLEGAVLMATKFDARTGDEFYRWASRRASYLALANISAANSLRTSGYYLQSGGWFWNPWFGMFTYVPYSSYYSPFGYTFWNPARVVEIYQPRPVYAGGGYGGFGGGRYDASAGGYSIGSRGMSSMGSSPSMGGISNVSTGVSAAPSGSSGSSGVSAGGGGGSAGSHGGAAGSGPRR